MQAAHDPTGMAEDPPVSIQKNHGNGNTSSSLEVRRERPKRTCTARSAARLHAAAAAEAEETARERRRKAGRRRERVREEEPEREPTPPPEPQCKIITQLVGDPPLSQAPRWGLRSMWELASVLNFLNVFRPLLNIKVEFSVEELETALITPNQTLADLHIPLLKAIPPIARMALGRNTWITVLCRKLRDWWYWVAEGELPIIASHGTEFEVYNKLDPGVRVIILKAICDIRVEQEDIRNYIDDSIKRGIHLSTFRKERVGGDSYGISYWYEDDPIIGHRLYREIRKVDGKKAKGKNAQPLPNSSYQWETVATNLDDFLDVSEKLFSSKNRTEASLGKKLKSDMLPEIEEVHKRKARLLKKQQREALLLDNVMHMDGFGPGRSLRGRKPVTYTFDDYDRSINEAIKINKNKPPSPDSITGRENAAQTDVSMDAYMNGRLNSTGQSPQEAAFDSPSPMSSDYDDEENKDELVDRSNRRRQRSQRYSAREYVDAISDNDDVISDNDEADSDFEDDIVGEAVYDDEYLRQRKRKRKMSSGSEGDEEYNWDDENLDDEEDDDDDNSLSTSEDSDEPRKTKKLRGRPGRRPKSKSVSELQSGLRRSRRATRNRINYKQYEMSDSEADLAEHERSNASNEETDTDHEDFSEESQNPNVEKENDEKEIVEQPVEEIPETMEDKVVQNLPPEKSNSSGEDEIEGVRKRRFLDLNELAPGSGFDDCPDTEMKDEDTDDF